MQDDIKNVEQNVRYSVNELAGKEMAEAKSYNESINAINANNARFSAAEHKEPEHADGGEHPEHAHEKGEHPEDAGAPGAEGEQKNAEPLKNAAKAGIIGGVAALTTAALPFAGPVVMKTFWHTAVHWARGLGVPVLSNYPTVLASGSIVGGSLLALGVFGKISNSLIQSQGKLGKYWKTWIDVHQAKKTKGIFLNIWEGLRTSPKVLTGILRAPKVVGMILGDIFGGARKAATATNDYLLKPQKKSGGDGHAAEHH